VPADTPHADRDRAATHAARFPLLPWLPSYRAAWLGRDAIAGLTLAAYAVPVSLAYSSLAGLPPEAGLYCYLAGGLVYAVLGTSPHLAIGPTSSIAIVLGATLGGLAGGDAARHVALGAGTALLVAAIALLAAALRFGLVASFVSDTVLTGFRAGAAIAIAATQLPALLGVQARGENVFELLREVAHRLPDTNLHTLAFGVAAVVLLALGQRLFPARPVALAVVAASLVASSVLDLGGHGVEVVGRLRAGLPEPGVPELALADARRLLPLALGCFLLSFVESIGAARTFAETRRETVDANRELTALGATNLVVGLVQGYPSAGGMSQTAVNERAGARSPLSLVFASLAIGAALLYATELLHQLPTAILAAVVLMAVKDLIDVGAFRHLRRVNKVEFRVAVVSLLGVLAFGILEGLLLAAIFSLAMLLRWAGNPHTAVLGRIPGTDRFGDVERHPGNETTPGVLIFRVEGGLYYFNVETVKQRFLDAVARHDGPLELVVFDLSTSPQIDLAGVRMLGELYDRLAERGVEMELAEAHAAVRELLRAEGMEKRFGSIDRATTCAGILDERAVRAVTTSRPRSDAVR